MTLRTRLALGIVSLVLPGAALAAAPGNVTGIKAVAAGSNVVVSWKNVTDQTISQYRVFYSHASILEQKGLYDDFENTEGSVNSLTLQNVPPVATLYVSVLAVNDKGEESAAFVEEAKVDLIPGTPATSMASSTSTMTQNGQTLKLLSVQALSATGVVLTFSHVVDVQADKAADAFTITNASGATLRATRLVIKGMQVTIHTTPQERGVVYQVQVGSQVFGKGVDSKPVVLDPNQAPMLFVGHESGVAPGTRQGGDSVAAQGGSTDVGNLRLRAQAETDRTYTVQALWQPPATAVTALLVYQTINGGKTFSEPVQMPGSAGGVSVPHVTAGRFGLVVRAVGADGKASKGVMQMVDLPGVKIPVSPLQATLVAPRTPKTKGLPGTGPEMTLALMLSGAVVGYRRMRKMNLPC